MSGNPFIVALVFGSLLSIVPAPLLAADERAVTVREDKDSFTLANGVIAARILKRNGEAWS